MNLIYRQSCRNSVTKMPAVLSVSYWHTLIPYLTTCKENWPNRQLIYWWVCTWNCEQTNRQRAPSLSPYSCTLHLQILHSSSFADAGLPFTVPLMNCATHRSVNIMSSLSMYTREFRKLKIISEYISTSVLLTVNFSFKTLIRGFKTQKFH